MQASMFNLRVPLPERDEVFLMNTLTDAQLVVSSDVASLLDGATAWTAESADPIDEEAVHGADGERLPGRRPRGRSDAARATTSTAVKNDTSELNVTLLTTLQCNFACDYCFQGDHGDYNKFAEKMSVETAGRVGDWIEARARSPAARTVPADVLRRRAAAQPAGDVRRSPSGCGTRRSRVGTPVSISIITNGLLLTEDVVDRMLPFGLRGVKITLDGDRETHDRMRPLRGGQGTFDRIIENIRTVVGQVRHRHRRQLRRELGGQLPGAARVPARAGVRRARWSRSTSSRSSATPEPATRRRRACCRSRRSRRTARRSSRSAGPA